MFQRLHSCLTETAAEMGYLCKKSSTWLTGSGANRMKGPETLAYNREKKNPKKTIKNYFSTGIEPLKMNANENISVKDFFKHF